MSVLIHGNEYITVAERVRMMLEAHEGQLVSVATEVLADTAETVTVKATVVLAHGTFTGHAQSHKDAGSVEGQAPLEVAETSAVGRALGFAGYGAVESIASAEEVTVAQARRPAVGRPTVPKVLVGARPKGAVPECEQCGRVRVWKEGVSKAGKDYRGWFCPDRDCDSKPIWVNDQPENIPEGDGDDLPFE